MIRTFVTGIIVGIANIIPGVSGGSILVIMGYYDRIMESIATFTKMTKIKRLETLKMLFILVLGLGLGLIGFSKGLAYLLENYYVITMWWFLGLIIFSYPFISKSELNGERINLLFLIIGLILVLVLGFFTPEKTDSIISLPQLSFELLLKIFFLGFIAGATMIVPGISGSLVLLILGEYYLFNTYISSLPVLDINVLLPVVILFIGIVIGIYLVSLFMHQLLQNHRRTIVSLILGFILGSLVVIVPKGGYDLMTIIGSLFALLIGAMMILVFNKKVSI